jgi:hypothetical protein
VLQGPSGLETCNLTVPIHSIRARPNARQKR